MKAAETFPVRRVYDPPGEEDGVRVLVDRLWPRGVSKERAAVDEWPKEVTPSSELRTWFHQHRDQHEEFDRRYRAELAGPEQQDALQHLRDLAAAGVVTLVTAVKDVEHGHLPTLRAELTEG
ncbi:DUF488 family protein [Streptomyces sp. NBC_01283]|uniref:DUF488 domain-containing protein n=1 Tax=Streptomyces sp. NBC_01283 TaxID=2903812 RepID=UPI00352FADB2|nr:DUF488 family protein [Streptomyces sp. NBC_01283]